MPRGAFSLSLVILSLALSAAGAQGAAGSELDALIAQLSAGAADAGFVDKALSAARSRPDIHEALALLNALSPKAPVSLRKPLLRERATLLEFLERWMDAAALWQEAASTPAGAGDADSLLSAGLCFLLGGDGARALAVSAAAKAVSAEPTVVDKARIITGWALLASGDRAAAYAEAQAVLGAGAKALRLAAFDLAVASAEAEAAAAIMGRRQAEYPELGAVAPHPRYALLSLAGKAQLWLPDEAPPAAPQGPVKPASIEAQESPGEAARPARYQVGAFKDAANAEAARKRLSDKGFTASVVVKRQGGDDVSVVYVAAGGDPAKTMIGLKDAGFEAWPLYE
jgi:hypothetical protein